MPFRTYFVQDATQITSSEAVIVTMLAAVVFIFVALTFHLFCIDTTISSAFVYHTVGSGNNTGIHNHLLHAFDDEPDIFNRIDRKVWRHCSNMYIWGLICMQHQKLGVTRCKVHQK